MKISKILRNSKGSITLYALVSMMFFLTVSVGVYTNTNNKVQEQDKQIEQIQESYEKEDDSNKIYEDTYEEIKDTITPTISIYGQDELIATIKGDKVNKLKTIYTHYGDVTLKFSSSLSGYEYAYSTTPDGTKIEGQTASIKVTEDGTTIYSYLKDVSTGKYFDKYTAVVIKLTVLNDKEIYVAEGKQKDIGVTGNKNIGDITYSDISDSTIVSVTDNKTLNGLKAGTTTLKATESNGGATATVTAKVTKIELEKQQGTMLLNDSKLLQVSGTNYGTLTAELSDKSVAEVSIQGSTLTIKANKVGTTTITITESNGGAIATYLLKVVNVTLSPNGGNYLVPTGASTATIKTTVTAENADKVEYAWGTSSGQESWKETASGTTINKTDCIDKETYYIYIRINEEVIYKSNVFTINGTTNKITITPDKVGWINQDVICTVVYPEESVNSTRKSAYGTTLSEATTNSNSATAPTTAVTVKENGYVYAQATDIAGNKVTASIQITNIDYDGPEISIVTVGTEYDYVDRVTITANDKAGITQYAVTQSVTQPTEWINTTSLNLSEIETKIEYGATWAKIFSHNNISGNELFTSDNEVLDTNSRYKFSKLGELENFRGTDGKFEFLLQYPNDTTQYNRWKQTDNPVTVTVPNGTGSETAAGYEAVHIDWTEHYWGGLTKSTSSATYINGSVGHGNWFYAIGAKSRHGNGIPSFSSTATAVELWVRIDTLESKAKTNVTVKVGNLKTNGKYYAWTKDSVGNISNKEFTVNKIDNTAPTISSLTSSNTNPTNKDITLTATASDEQATLYSKAYGWNAKTSWTNSNTSSVSENGTYTVYVIDQVGNIASKPITVDNIDKTAPTLSSINVTSPEAGTYKAGQVVTIVATYSEDIYGTDARAAVTSTTAPVLKIKFGSSAERTATFSKVSGKTITYTYKIASGDNGALATTSHTGKVYDVAGNELTVVNKTIGGKAITADTTAPTLSNIKVTSPAAGTYKAGQAVTIVATYSENITGTAPALGIKFGSTAGKGTVSAGAIDGSTITYTYTITAGDNGLLAINSYTGTALTDTVGNAWTAPSIPSNTGNAITADTTAPTLSSINVTSPEAGTYKAGQAVTIVATYSENIYGNASKAAVTSTTAPVLKIKFGSSTERTTTFSKVSGKTITYTYTIASGDNGALATTSHSGKVYDVAGNELTVANKTIGGKAITADTTAPTLSNIKVTSPAAGTYKAGQSVTIVATYSENITGTAPALGIKFGSTAGKGTVSAGTINGSTITYTYTITAGDNGLLAISSYTGTALTDTVGNAWTAPTTTPSNTGNAITADTTAPTLSSINVTSPEAGTYKAGQAVTIVATYSENIYGNASKAAVTSTTAPVLKIKFGSSTERTATFSKVSGKTITYTYTIASGDNGALATTSHSGKVYDVAGNELTVANKTIGGKAITADTTAPTLSHIKVTSPAAGTYKAGQAVTIVATYSENITGTAPALGIKFGTTAGKGTVSAGTIDGSTITYTYTITAGDNGLLAINSYTGTALTDTVGNAWTAPTTTPSNTGNAITADTTAPTLSSINVTSPEAGTYKAGQSVTIVATYSENIYGNASKAAVTSTTAPVLKIKFGSSAERTATFSKVSGKTITYTYTIASGDNGALATTSHSGKVYDVAGNELTVANKTIGGKAITADTTAPTISSINVTSPEAGTYKAGQVVTIVATYSENIYGNASKAAVTSTTAPVLKIKFGSSTERTATFSSTSGKTITYTYKIVSGDNGTLATTSHSGTVYDAVGNSKTVENKAIGGNAITADTTAPGCSVKPSTSNWTNANVTLTGTATDTGSGIVAFGWTTDETEPTGTTTTGELGKWTSISATTAQISKTATLSVNGTRHFWTKDAVGNVNNASCTINKIDKLAPNAFTPTAASTLNSITVTASTTDQEATTSYAKSGIAGYRFRINSGSWTAYKTSGTYTFTGLSQATSYTVDVQAKDNAGNTKTGSVTIKTKEVTLSLSATSGYVKVGGSKQITASGSNYGSITVSSSNTNVATVSISGTTITIAGKSAGTATITAKASNNTSKTATYTIKVTSLTAPSTTSHTVEIGKTVTLTAPTKSTYAGTITYTSSNTSVATVNSSSGLVTAKAGGTAKITAKEGNGGATVTYTISVPKNQLLINRVNKGDYVNYPISYTSAESFCSKTSTYTGWRVLYKYGDCVWLVSAGCPLVSGNTTVSNIRTKMLNTDNFNTYKNSTYANGVRSLNKSDLDYYLGTSINTTTKHSDTIIKTGGWYYLPDYYDSAKTKLWCFNGNYNQFCAQTADREIGIRVVVQLKSTIRTTGQSSSVWQLTTSTGL